MSLPLVLDPTRLADLLSASASGNPNAAEIDSLRIVDLRSAEHYAAGHLPGAVHADAALLNRSDPPVNGLLPEPATIERLLSDIGLSEGQHVVAYDEGGATTAARMIWVLHAYGLPTCSWLNGGFAAWVAADAPVSTEAASAAAGNLQVTASGKHLISANELLTRLDDADLAVLDVRSEAEYVGEDVRAAMGGHVPGAVHQNWVDTLDAHRQLLADEVLLTSLAERGITPDKHVVVYCQSHQRSSMSFVMLKHLGFDRVSALDGAWSAWGNRPDLPKERGQPASGGSSTA